MELCSLQSEVLVRPADDSDSPSWTCGFLTGSDSLPVLASFAASALLISAFTCRQPAGCSC